MGSEPLLLIAAGGTGGHMFPAQALAEEMLHRGWRVKLSTDPRGARYTGGFPHSVQVEVVESGTFSGRGAIAKLKVPFQIVLGTFSAWRKMRKDPPAVVAGFGGYPALPAMIAASLSKRPRMIHEQNGVLGRVNKAFAKHVNRVACGTWPTELPEGIEAFHTGNPVRGAVREKCGASYIPPGDWPMNLLVMGGSQGARILSNVVPAAVALLPGNIKLQLRVTQQARPEDAGDVIARYEELGIDHEVSDFFRDIPRRLSEAQLVISRAGASSVADIAAVGRPSILIPLAIATDDHQTANARALASSGAAIVVQETQLNAETLADLIKTVLADGEGAQHMALAAAAQGKPDAAVLLADMVEDLAKQGM